MAQLEIREALYAQIQLIPAAVAIAGTRVLPAKERQGTPYPHVIYWRVHEKRLSCMDHRTGNATAVFMIDCWAETPDEAAALARAIRGTGRTPGAPTLDFFKGWFGGGSGVGVMVQHAEVEDMDEDEDRQHDNRPQQGDDVGVYRETLVFSVFYNEP